MEQDKKALVISRQQLQKFVSNFPNPKDTSTNEAVFLLGEPPKEFFTELDLTLMPRLICETDPDFLQVIPYVVLTSLGGREMFVYSRGQKGNEPALRGSLSIGLGGHIDELPKEGQSFSNLIACEAARELNEEVGLVYGDEFITMVENAIVNNSFLLFSNKNDVSNVHVGLAFNLEIDAEEIKKIEEGVIVNHRWADAEKLHSLLTSADAEFEIWSLMIIEYLISIQTNNVQERT